MADNNQEIQPDFQIELNPDVAQGEYANLALITHSSSDFVLDFVRILPGIPKPQVRSCVVMAPEHAKRLLGALQENILKYEQVFGRINIPNRPEQSMGAFNNGGGEA